MARIGTLGALVILLLLLACWSDLAHSAPPSPPRCPPYAEVAGELARFGETPVEAGIVPNRGVAVLFKTEDGATWTLVFLVDRGQGACVVVMGENWRQAAEIRPEWKEPGQ